MVRFLSWVSVLALLSGCADPLSAFDRLGDVDIAEDAPTAAAALPSEDEVAREGFFGTAAATPDVTSQAAVETASQSVPARRGLVGLLTRRSDAELADRPAFAQTDAAEQPVEAPAVELAALAPSDQTDGGLAAAPAVPIAKRKGLLGLLNPKPNATPSSSKAPRNGPDARDVPPGTVLPFGEVARVCEAKGSLLGKRVERASARGFALYDTAPDTIAARTFHITGFADGCARQITAATVILSPASSYEQFRFGPTGAHLPRGATDSAYDGVKRQVCNVGKNKPCGGQIKTLDRDTFFVSSYRDLRSRGEWAELLVHRGSVEAVAVKSYD